MYQTKNERAQSYFINMRRFHNSIKRSLYNKYTKNIKNLLELAVGKAGDLNKWVDNKIENIIGYDINETSINEAKHRVKEMVRRNTKNNIMPNINLYVKDLSKNIIEGSNDQDAVISMFAFHYFFESQETFNTIMASIENNLKDDGLFIGCMFDGNSINKLLTPLNEHGIQSVHTSCAFDLKDNGVTRFRIEGKNQNDTCSLFGNKISVYIKDTVLDIPMDEYIVDFDKFVNVMKTRNFDLIESKMFNDEAYLSKNFNLNNIEKQASFLNRTFVFKKYIPIKTNNLTKLCENETSYLMKCDWSNDDYKHIILENYKNAIKKQIKLHGNRNKLLLLIKDNFLNNEYLLSVLTGNYKKWYTEIYNMFLTELNNYTISML